MMDEEAWVSRYQKLLLTISDGSTRYRLTEEHIARNQQMAVAAAAEAREMLRDPSVPILALLELHGGAEDIILHPELIPAVIENPAFIFWMVNDERPAILEFFEEVDDATVSLEIWGLSGETQEGIDTIVRLQEMMSKVSPQARRQWDAYRAKSHPVTFWSHVQEFVCAKPYPEWSADLASAWITQPELFTERLLAPKYLTAIGQKR